MSGPRNEATRTELVARMDNVARQRLLGWGFDDPPAFELRTARGGLTFAEDSPIMLKLRRRALLQSFAAGSFLAAVPSLGCSSSEEVEETLDELESREAALLKVKKIVIVMMENRSFDHYFGHLTIPGANPTTAERYDYKGGKPDQRQGDRRVNGLTGKEWNPKKPGGSEADGVKVFNAHEKSLGYSIGDINHEWVECHNQWNPERVAPGKMPTKGDNKGFVIEHLRDRGELGELGPAYAKTCDSFPVICEQGTPTGGALICGAEAGAKSDTAMKLAACGHADAPMAYYGAKDTPVFHAFYERFVLCDNWYSSVCGPTWPNRYYVHSASAASAIGTSPTRDRRGNLDTIFKVLKESNVAFYNFFSDAPLVTAMYGGDANDFQNGNSGMARVFAGQSPTDKLFAEAARNAKGSLVTGVLNGVTNTLAKDDSFETRCAAGTLPPVSYIEPPYFCADDHPPHDIQMGQAFVKSIYTMLYGPKASQDQRDSTLLVVMYDEHGSFYDHQDPGLAYSVSSGDKDVDRNFKPLGFRVPAMVVGPMVKQSHVSHTVYDHTSVVRTIYNWVGVHAANQSTIFDNDRGPLVKATPRAAGAQTAEMIEEIYRAGYDRNHPLRPLHASLHVTTVHKPMLRVMAANDISDCLDPNYEPGRTSMPAMPEVRTTEGRVLASMQWSEGQQGFAEAHGLPQPTFRRKMEAAKVVMEHMYRLGAVDIG